MDVPDGSIRPLFAGWERYNERIIDGLRGRSAAELALTVGSTYLPIWAIAGHTAGARVYWLCAVFGEPGAETTPFTDPTGFGWEDDLATPRSAEELVWALESSWRIVAGCLERWTPAMLEETFRRERRGQAQLHTRQSVLVRLLAHDAYHAGEIALIQGSHGLPNVDLWPKAPPTAAP
jgi:hypothetical protein